ncbi:SOUL heme-binding protein [Gracilaria domingensis]|nr:SOUL heme-binding protein [Gracilaria domingensis]
MQAFAVCLPVCGSCAQSQFLIKSTSSTRQVRHSKRVRRFPLASSSNDSSDGSATWQQELQLLLNPNLTRGAKEVLLQDLAKRTPEIFDDTRSLVCNNPNVKGLRDVFRQLSEDVIPDLLLNGPRYFSRAMQDLPDNVSRVSKDTAAMREAMPRPTREEFQREFRNIFNRTPEGLYTPEYKVLCSYEGYEIREYPTVIVATSKMNPDRQGSEATEVESASAMGQSFNTLAGYLFGKNESKTAMKMTTPVVLDKGSVDETMSFIIGEYSSVEDVPKTLDESVTLREEVGKTYAVLEFSGFVTQGEAKRQRERLLSLIAREDVQTTEEGKSSYKCLVYNGPSTLPSRRRNDMMIEVVYPRKETE